MTTMKYMSNSSGKDGDRKWKACSNLGLYLLKINKRLKRVWEPIIAS